MVAGIALVLAMSVSAGAQSPNSASVASASASDSTSSAGRPVFKSGVDLVGLNVTVTDKRQRYIPGLDKEQFQILEDGVPQDVTFFAAATVPLDLAILLDTSASMGSKIEVVRQAATGFVHHIHPGDRASIVSFNNTVRVLETFTDDLGALDRAIRQTSAYGTTSLHNAIYIALKEFTKHVKDVGEVRRHAIVVLSDGQDTASLISSDDVLDLAKRSGVGIYTIALKSQYEALLLQSAARSRAHAEADYDMKTLARETGARSFFPLEIAELQGVYGQIADELSHQYSLGYASKNLRHDGAFRRVVVRLLSRPDAYLRTRTGYFSQRP